MQAAAKHARERSVPDKHPNTESATSKRQMSPYIDKLEKKLQSIRPRRDGFIRISGKRQFTIAITPSSAERTITFLGRIWDELQARGYDLAPTDEGLAFRIDSELVGFSLSEALEREPHEPTQAEQARLKRWEDSCRRKRRRGEYVSTWDKPKIPEYDHVARDRLVFEFTRKINYRGLRYRYADGKHQRIEKLADRIVTAAAVHAATIIEQREERERWRREWEEKERRRREVERQRRLEEKRWEFLESRMKKLNVAIDLKKFVEDYTSAYPFEDLPASCQQLLRWADSTAEAIRQEISPDQLAFVLDKHQLMDDQTVINSWVKLDD
jgi:cell division septum initiation protein DivIVA